MNKIISNLIKENQAKMKKTNGEWNITIEVEYGDNRPSLFIEGCDTGPAMATRKAMKKLAKETNIPFSWIMNQVHKIGQGQYPYDHFERKEFNFVGHIKHIMDVLNEYIEKSKYKNKVHHISISKLEKDSEDLLFSFIMFTEGKPIDPNFHKLCQIMAMFEDNKL